MKRFIMGMVFILFLIGCSNNPAAGPTESIQPDVVAPSSQETRLPAPTDKTEPSAEQTKTAPTGKAGVTTPVLIKGFLAGGLINGVWKSCEEFYNSGAVDLNGYIYDFYADGKRIGTAKGGSPVDFLSGETLKGNTYIPGYDMIALKDGQDQKVEYDIALRGDWDLFPGEYRVESTVPQEYSGLVEDLLVREGLQNADADIKQVFSADLDGDGNQETLIAADNTVNGQFEQVKKGDYAVLVFLSRNMPDAQVVDKDVRLEDEEEVSIYRLLFRAHSAADLDGDGIMEVIVRSWYYEGESWSVYKLISGRLELVASNGAGV